MLPLNNFNALRLALATAVILSHSPQLLDGDKQREYWHLFFGTLSLGEVSVNLFFVISGYLILKSFDSSSNIIKYIIKRVLRIYPGYIAAYWISFLLALCVGGVNAQSITNADLTKALLRSVALAPPYISGAFRDLPIQHINGSMWTIAYEFRCYLLVVLFYMLGILRVRRFFLAITILLYASLAFSVTIPVPSWLELLLGRPDETRRFVLLFCSGGVFYLYRDKIPYQPFVVGISSLLFVAAQTVPSLAEVGIGIFGSYILFYYCIPTRMNNETNSTNVTDLSYGIYLYGWPIQIGLITTIDGIDVFMLSFLSLILSALAGFASWKLVEEPFLRLKTRLRENPA